MAWEALFLRGVQFVDSRHVLLPKAVYDYSCSLRSGPFHERQALFDHSDDRMALWIGAPDQCRRIHVLIHARWLECIKSLRRPQSCVPVR
jgi:hypothetical protein